MAKRRAATHLIKEQKEAADKLGVTDRQLRNWMKEASFPDCSEGYDLESIKAWRESNKRTGSDAREKAQQLLLDLKQERVSQEAIKTKQMQLRLAEQEGELLPRRVEELAIATIGTKLGDWCDQLPDLIRGECCSKCCDRVAERVKAELNQGRADLVQELKNLRSS